jgi:hypothetical protein
MKGYQVWGGNRAFMKSISRGKRDLRESLGTIHLYIPYISLKLTSCQLWEIYGSKNRISWSFRELYIYTYPTFRLSWQVVNFGTLWVWKIGSQGASGNYTFIHSLHFAQVDKLSPLERGKVNSRKTIHRWAPTIHRLYITWFWVLAV